MSVPAALADLARLTGATTGVAAGAGVRTLGDPDLAGASAGLPVGDAFAPLLPGGLPRGRTVAVGGGAAGATTLLLGLLAAASADGAWCALVDLPATGGAAAAVNAEAVTGLGVAPERLVLVRGPADGWSRSGWVTAVGALVDAFDVVAFRVGTGVAPGDGQRLAARARARGAVLVPYLPTDGRWPGTTVRLQVAAGGWSGLDDPGSGTGGGRLRRRRVTVAAAWTGREARPRTSELWLPAAGGGVAAGGVGGGAPLQVVAGGAS